MASIIKCENLTFSYGQEKLFKGINFCLKPGDKVALTGPSGRGKSTLLNIIAGFLPNFSGNISVVGLPLNAENIKRIRMQMAWLPQQTDLNFDTAEQALIGIFEFKENQHLKPTHAQILEIFHQFELPKDLLYRKFSELSGGQRQRILLASALLSKKKLIILDEPSSALDEKLKHKITDIVLAQPAAVLASVHDPYWIQQSDYELKL